jgi:hypothetical protein
MNRNSSIGREIADEFDRFLPESRASLAKCVQDLGENLMGCYQFAASQSEAGILGGLVPLILAVGDRYPIERIGKYPSHGDGCRFGTP